MRFFVWILLAGLALGAAACAPKQSAGFTGIGGEPATKAPDRAQTQVVAPATVIYTPSYVPQITAPAQKQSFEGQVQTAIAYGGTEPRRSVPVALGGSMLALSIVDVGGQDFAVVKPRGSGAVPGRAASELQANAAVLTGCVPQGAARGGAAGIALPLDCS